jgi:NADP-dependent 3-hydroxy acid dehydrogenase YdfG
MSLEFNPYDLSSMIDFTDQVAVVTGAGRGLGRLYALELARRGAAVVVNDVGGTMHGDGADPSVADRVVAEIVQAGGAAVASYDSVATPEGGEAIVRTALDRFDRVDAVVSNAGIFSSVPFDELSPSEWRRMLAVHLDGGFHLCQPAFRAMKARAGGRFVIIASSAGMFGQPMEAHYAAAKAGLVRLTNRGLPRQPRLRLQPSQLLGLRRALRAGLRRPRRGLARRARQQGDRRGDRRAHRAGVGHGSLHRSVVDRRRSARHVRAARRHAVAVPGGPSGRTR